MAENQDTFYLDKFIRVALIIGIVAWTFQLLYPLLGVLVWGFVLAVIFYPLYHWINSHIGNKPIIAGLLITILMLVVVISITWFITNDIAQSVTSLTEHMQNRDQLIPSPPESIKQWPLVGDKFYQTWSSATINLGSEISKHSETLLSAGKYGLGKVLNASKDFIAFIISILLAGYWMVHATSFMNLTRKFANRVAKENGTNIINMIKETIQNVSRGVIGISLLQTYIFWQLLVIVHAPGAGLLSILALVISIAQVGLFILIIPVIIWLFFTKSFLVAFIVSIFLGFDALLDSFLKPFVLARGLATPMMIIFIGVIGGIISYGMIGVFIGPVVLAVAYDLFLIYSENRLAK